MSKEDIDRKIQEAVEALLMAKERINDTYVFEAEGLIEEARDLTRELYKEISKLAEEQEKDIEKQEMERGYEVSE